MWSPSSPELLPLNTSLHAVCGVAQSLQSSSLQGHGLEPALASVIPCSWTRFPRPGMAIVSIITMFYVIVGLSAIILNGLVVILYFR